MRIIFSRRFYEQLPTLSDDAKEIVDKKLDLLKHNPFRFKRLFYPDRHLFRIRFSDRRAEKRIIFEVKDDSIIVWCILDRKDDYDDLEKNI